MEELKCKRALVEARLNRFEDFLNTYENAPVPDQLKVRLKQAECLLAEFSDIQTAIDVMEKGNIQHEEWKTFEDKYFQVIGQAKQHIEQIEKQIAEENANKASINNIIHKQVSAQLPSFNLPTFSGSYEEWQSFYDIFKSMVHDNDSIIGVQKFHYLKSQITGEASQLLLSFQVTEENYNIVWTLLQERYENKRLMTHVHVKALFELQSVVKDRHQSLRSLLDSAQKHIRALKSLKQPTEQWDTLLIYLITSKFDINTLKAWESSTIGTKGTNELPTMQELLKFMQTRSQVLETVNRDKETPTHSQKTFKQAFKQQEKGKSAQQHSYVTTKESSCPVCTQDHRIYACKRFLQFTVEERRKEVKKLALCYNCLRSNHTAEKCLSGTCRKCSKRHNTLLHHEVQAKDEVPKEQTMEQVNTCATTTNTCCYSVNNAQVILSTAIISVINKYGHSHPCRVLLDSGSQSNFISEKMAKILELKKTPIHIPVVGINQAKTTITSMMKATIESKYNNFRFEATFLVIPRITDTIPTTTINRDLFPIPDDIYLADPYFNEATEVDMLLGAEFFFKILTTGQISLNINSPVMLQATHFGWVVTGKIHGSNHNKQKCFFLQDTLNSQLQQFWELEESCEVKTWSQEETNCENHFLKHVTRNTQGKFVVSLPFKEVTTQLGESYATTLRRFQSLERKLEQNPDLRTQYSAFLKEYEELGHMKRIQDIDDTSSHYYMPHHAVIKEDSLSTKTRIVFDASAVTSTGVSLNQILMVGPTVQETLFSIISRFRLHKYVLSADIEKMYRQIMLNPEDTKYHRILWRNSTHEDIQRYELQTVTYGTAAAPYLATRCILKLAEDEEGAYPNTCDKLKTDVYVDDILTGADDLQEVLNLRNELILILHKGGFHPRKWISNESSLLKDIIDKSDPLISLNISETVKTLGLQWNAQQDCILYKVNSDQNSNNFSKRQILSQIAKLFDPLGLIGPTIVVAKLIMQEIWKLKTDWDIVVPDNIQQKWIQFIQQLPLLHNLSIPRRIVANNSIQIQLHGFCDASTKAYGACIMLRSTDVKGEHSIHLVCSKSKVAPLKEITLPRLELCAALLLANLYSTVKDSLKLKFDKTYLWSDSTITLCWINTEPYKLKTFVSNRISQIRSLTNQSDWNHIRSADNPADTISRGQLPSQILENKLWWNGPQWLSKDETLWPYNELNFEVTPEHKIIVTIAKKANDLTEVLHKYSNFNKLVKIIAYCFRFYKRLKTKIKFSQPLTVEEIEEASTRIIKLIQQEFTSEIKALQKGEDVLVSSKIRNLNPFLDRDGILRVGGRLRNAKLTYDQQHQILLPKSHYLTKLIIRDIHIKSMHPGVQGTLNFVRMKYWPINGRNSIKQVIKQCITCYKINPKVQEHIMGDIPQHRLSVCRPFTFVGIDYCGPFFIKERRSRGKIKIKIYIAIFICFTCKAVHIEMVSDLSTDAFLCAFRRFVARRGKPLVIYSDNATNFVGAARELQELQELFNSEAHKQKFCSYLTKEEIKWKFIPPRTPHFGGLWEAAVKSFKTHFKKIIGLTILTYEEFHTVITGIESILNNRPLTALSNDPNDLLPLTPFHFLIGGSINPMQEANLIDIKTTRLSSWQQLQQIKQVFWKRWQKEYYNQLQVRAKWHTHSPNITPGTLVLLKEDNLPPLHWILGRVVQVHPGADNVIRVVTVKTSSGTFKRPTRKLCPLPVISESES